MHIKDIMLLVEKHKDIIKILNEKNSNSAIFVGGCVRDFISTGKIPDDIDISTILEPNEVVEVLRSHKKEYENFVILDKDKKYGTIIAILNNQKYEITTTRSDIACFGRDAEVKFCKSFEIDSQRRDFTINALYLSEDGKIFDFHGGIADLENKKIKFIGDADKRIKEDYLRIIRFFRFATKYNTSSFFDEQTIATIQNNKEGIKQLSRERIKNEIWKMLSYDNWFYGLQLFSRFDLLNEVFLVDNQETNADLEGYKKQKNVSQCNEVAKLFYFFKCNISVLEQFCETLKFTKQEKRVVEFLRKTWKFCEKEHLCTELKLLLFSDNDNLYEELLPILNDGLKEQILDFKSKQKPLPISSNELLEKGFQGKQLGEKIKALQTIWVENDFNVSKEELRQYI